MEAKKSEKNTFFYIAIAVAVVLQILRAFFSTDISTFDEAQYLVNGLQLCNGSALLVDDWNATQLSGLFNAPFILLFKIFTKGTDGAILYLRFVFIAIKAVICLWAVKRSELSENNAIPLKVTSLVSLIYSLSTMNTISYNTIMMLAGYMMVMILLTYRDEMKDRVFLGVLLSFAVLSNPYAILLYLFFIVYAVVLCILKKTTPSKAFHGIVDITLGAIPLAIIFFIVAFAGSGVREVFANVGNILASPDHDMVSMGPIYTMLAKTWYFINKTGFLYSKVTLAGIAEVIIAFVFAIKKRKENAYPFVLAITAMMLIYILVRNGNFVENYIFIPFIYLALSLLILEFSVRRLVIFIFTSLIIECVGIGTVTGVVTVSGFCSLFCVLIAEMLSLPDRLKKITNYIPAVTVILVLILQMARNWTGPTDLSSLNNPVTRGPLKGTFLPDGIYEEYNAKMDEFERAGVSKTDSVFCAVYEPLVYSYYDIPMGGTFFYYEPDRDIEYLSTHKDKDFTVMYFAKKVPYSDITDLAFSSDEERIVKTVWKNYEVKEFPGSFFVFKR
ncbi:MAG: hypothetical protein K5888_12320 [Lachnospiraceae bacterium]|nr:hypothetical protein [Lachnospiraceae bacterium]